jgi:hypothetical protein
MITMLLKRVAPQKRGLRKGVGGIEGKQIGLDFY